MKNKIIYPEALLKKERHSTSSNLPIKSEAQSDSEEKQTTEKHLPESLKRERSDTDLAFVECLQIKSESLNIVQEESQHEYLPIPIHVKEESRKGENNVTYVEIDSIINQKNVDLQNIDKSKSKYACSYCQLIFSDATSLDAHVRQYPGVAGRKKEDKKRECSECNYKTKKPDNLKRHMLSHSGERAYHCTECDYKAIHKSHLEVHIKYKHTKEKPYSCNLCDYKCTQYYMLNKHKLVHSTDKPFQCDQCDKSFRQKYYLVAHLFTHSDKGKPFKCTKCEYSTVLQNSLKRHMNTTHYNERPYSCDLCDYHAFSPYKLKVHRYKHSKSF